MQLVQFSTLKIDVSSSPCEFLKSTLTFSLTHQIHPKEEESGCIPYKHLSMHLLFTYDDVIIHVPYGASDTTFSYSFCIVQSWFYR